MDKIIRWLEEHQSPCSIRELSGLDCPGCGFQRAFILLLKGDILASIQMYPALIPFLVMCLYLALHLIFRFRKGGKVLMWMFVINAVLVVGSFIIKIVVQH